MPDFGEFVGIDVGKAELFVHVQRTGEDLRFANSPTGIGQLITRLSALGGSAPRPVAVVFEATGGVEHALWRALEAAAGLGLVVRQLCPRRVRHFAKARGPLAKTDRLDAATLAAFAAHFPGEGRAWPGATIAGLGALVLRRQALVQVRKGLVVRQDRAATPLLAQLDAELVRVLDAQIRRLETVIAQEIAAEAALAAKAELLRSIPGIGPVVTAGLLARMPELGAASDRQVAAMAGLAPVARDSGTLRGRRRIDGGRAELRAVLFQAAMAAIRANPAIAAFAARLKAAGKAHKQVVIAAARKLLVQANAVLKRGTPWHA